MAAVLAGCRAARLGYQAPPAGQALIPYPVVVWRVDDATTDPPVQSPSSDGVHAYESSLTQSGSAWRPQLTRDVLTDALAAEVRARIAPEVWVRDDAYGQTTLEDLLKGARLFVSARVDEAAWDRSDAEGGRYRLKMTLSATLARTQGPNLVGFWTKVVTADVPHAGWPAPELRRALSGMLGPAVADLGKALAQKPAASALGEEEAAQAAEQAAAQEQGGAAGAGP